MTKQTSRELQQYIDKSDHELIDAVRSGELNAYGALWQRHSGPAYSVARTFPTLDADDLVADSFVKVLDAIRAGGGPTGAFRPYITMAVRNLGRTKFVRDKTPADVDLDWLATGIPNGEAHAVAAFEDSVMATAFRSLPERWQEVLWYREVDEMKPAEIATYVGIEPNAVSALLIRARRGLRDAWVSAHVARAHTEECAAIIQDLGGYVRGGLSARATAQVDAHLATCEYCPAALEEARLVSSKLAFVLLPAVLGVAGAAGYAAHLSAPAMPQALYAMGIEPESEPEPPSRKRAALIAGAVLLLLLLGAAAVILVQSMLGVLTEGARNVPFGTGSQVSPTPVPDASSTPAPAPSASPTPDPTASSDTNAPSDNTVPSDADDASTGDQGPGGSTDPNTETPTDGQPVADPLTAPSATLTQPDARMYPRLAGTGARPGATIEARDEGGALIATSTVKADGSWRASVTNGAAGTHTVTVTQALAGEVSPTSPALTFTTSTPPTITAPAAGAVVSASSFPFSLAAPAGTILERDIVGVTRTQTLRLPAEGQWNERLSTPQGTQTIRVRYANPQTGDFGPYSSVTVIAQ